MTRQQLIDNALVEFDNLRSLEIKGMGKLYTDLDVKTFLITHLNLMADSVIEGEEKI